MEAGVSDFVRDESHWLFRLAPDEWIRAGLADLERAQKAYAQRNARAGLAGARRAAGMALNGALIVEPNEAWGRSYVDHLKALGRDSSVPERVREACKELTETPLPGQGSLVPLRTSRTASTDERVLEAARDVIAHAYAIVKRHAP
jgi:HEPN domain-containing protein